METEKKTNGRFTAAVIILIIMFLIFFCAAFPAKASAAPAVYRRTETHPLSEPVHQEPETTTQTAASAIQAEQTQPNSDTAQENTNTDITEASSPVQQFPKVTGYTSSISKSSITMPAEGRTYARIRVSGTTLDQPVYYGDSDEILMKGIGTYQYYGIPGEGTTTLICGHCQLYMAPMEQARTGDTVTLDTDYGTYIYQIESIEVKTPQQWESEWNDDAAKARGEYLILYCCYPFGKTSYTKTERIFYNCRFISGGPQLISD